MLAERVPEVSQLRTARQLGDARLREIVTAFADSLERGDADALIGLLTADVTWSMPPLPHWYAGAGPVGAFATEIPLAACGDWLHLPPLTVNGQPAVAGYRRAAPGEDFRAWSVTVLTLRGDRIAGITSFLGDDAFTLLGLPPTLVRPATGG